jgi:hypothetical protein
VQNVAALKNLSGMVDGVVVVTRGYYTQGDGGAANYFWNSADTSTDNGGSVIALSGGGTGRWNVLFTGNTATFEQFGAKGDGATNDQATLQAAMTWAGTSPYRSLRGTTGRTYKINSGLTVAPNVAIDWNNSTVNASAVASAYVFTMTGVSVEYVVDAPWRNGFVQMSSNATPTIIKISRTVGKLFEGMHFEGVASKCIEYGDNTWLIEWKNGFCKSNSSTSAGAVGTGVYIPAGLFNSGENMKFTGYTFSGLAVAFEIGNEQFDIYCIACAVDYSQKVMHATASSNLSFIGGHLESDYNGAWFQWTAGATGYGQLSLSNLRWLLAASVTNNIIDDGSSTISVKLHGVQMGFSNYTPRDLFKNGSAPISYSQIDVANPEFAPRIGFYLSDPNFTAAGARDWTVGVYDNGGVPAGTVTWTAAAGPSGQYAARLDPDNAGGYVGLYRTISTLSGSPGAYTRLKVQIQYKLQGGKTDANNALELLTVTKDQSGTLQGYSKTAITNATSSWQTYNYVINIAPNADVKFYIEAHDNGGGVNPVFDVSMIWLEIL